MTGDKTRATQVFSCTVCVVLCCAMPCFAVEVQRMLLAEEVAAHKQRTGSSTGSSSSSSIQQALLQLLDAASHQQALLQHAECVLAPALQAMRQMAAQQELQVQQLEADNTRLQVRQQVP